MVKTVKSGSHCLGVKCQDRGLVSSHKQERWHVPAVGSKLQNFLWLNILDT